MPWSTPNLRTVRQLVRDSLRANLPGADALVPNSVLRVLSDNQGALCALTLQYLDWLALQLMPDTAETEWLSRHGDIWLVNSDGTTGRKMAQLAGGEVTMTATIPWSVIPQGTRLTSGSIGQGTAIEIDYETTEQAFLSVVGAPTNVKIRALDPGTAGNMTRGSTLRVVSTVSGVNNAATVVYLDGGVDEETDDQLRYRVLERIRHPPQGGAWHDYVKWALAVPGVTRAWANPLEMGMGTVTIRFMMDSLRADRDGFPTETDVQTVRDYLDKVRPVAVKDLFVAAPIPQPINVVINNLKPDTPAVRAAIATNLRNMLIERAAPGQTIYAAWKTHAVMDASGVASFDLGNCDKDDVMLSPGHMSRLGNIVYG